MIASDPLRQPEPRGRHLSRTRSPLASDFLRVFGKSRPVRWRSRAQRRRGRKPPTCRTQFDTTASTRPHIEPLTFLGPLDRQATSLRLSFNVSDADEILDMSSRSRVSNSPKFQFDKITLSR